MALLVILFMGYWFGFLGVYLVESLWKLVGREVSGSAIDGYWQSTLFAAGMISFGIGLVWFCRYLARDEQAFLTTFIRDTLKASEVPAGPV
jgi:hypothetical protein